MLAAVNPCGFALLPAYLTLLVVGDRVDSSFAGRLAAIGRALALTAAMTVGFVAVFGVFGLLAAPLGPREGDAVRGNVQARPQVAERW